MNKVIDIIGDSVVWKFFVSRRMKALYWTTLAQFIAASGDIIIQTLTEWNPEAYQTVFAGLVIAQITKMLNTQK